MTHDDARAREVAAVREGSMGLQEKLRNRRVVASISGGKDSAALALWLGIEHDRVFIDTGWEHQTTYDYVRGPLTDRLGPIVEIKAPADVDVPLDALRPRVRAAVEQGSAMVGLILRKGMFPSRAIRFCTQELKAAVIRKWITAQQDAGQEIINTVGIRAQESRDRSELQEWEWSEDLDCEIWRPLITWDVRDVIDIHHRHGLTPNPLYLRGASRVGCWPCIFARKSDIRRIAESDPERMALIGELEADLFDLGARRYAARGESHESLGYARPTFFRPAVKDGKGEPWPIDRL